LLTPADEEFLLELLSIDTVSPLDSGDLSDLRRAQEALAAGAAREGFVVAHHAPPPASALEADGVPLSLRERAAELGSAFLENQPNLVLRLGPERPEARTIAFNVHLDTVADALPVERRDGVVVGRGAVDAKGLAVGILAGVREALRRRPGLAESTTVLLQAVGGEEGGAMGVLGTRVVAALGYTGRLNVVAEPTSLRFFDRTTTSMTARVEVAGTGSTDDEPTLGQNATILLGAVVDRLARRLAPRVEQAGGKLCIAGLHTGDMHNRVYGSGRLLLNFAYPSAQAAQAIERAAEEELGGALADFAQTFASVPVAQAAAESADEICRLVWVKRGLPVLANRDAELEAVLAAAGLRRHEDDGDAKPFTCDAMWLQGERRYTVVFGPGDLGANRAHADGEFVELAELDRYAAAVADMVVAFGDWAARSRGGH
jgi:acetylornithine deacetylase